MSVWFVTQIISLPSEPAHTVNKTFGRKNKVRAVPFMRLYCWMREEFLGERECVSMQRAQEGLKIEVSLSLPMFCFGMLTR